jgi:hypothetical protein
MIHLTLVLTIWGVSSKPLVPHPSNAANTTAYAIRPLALVDITDKDSADAAGDIFFWIKDHVVKPMHCRVEPFWHQCNETSTIDVNMVYQTFVVEYDREAVGPYASCNPDDKAPDPSTAPWVCGCHGGSGCTGFGKQTIASHTRAQFEGDPTPVLSKKFTPGYWFSTTHNTECGNPRANASVPCTWRKYSGKIVNADCVNNKVIAVATAASSGDVAACEKNERKPCNFTHPVQTNLTNCCINAFVKGINATTAETFIAPFEASFKSEDQGGCPEVQPPLQSRAMNELIV